MALPTNTFRRDRYIRSRFREGKYLLAAEASDIQLESFDLLRQYIERTYGNIAVQDSFKADQISGTLIRIRPGEAWQDGVPYLMKSGTDPKIIEGVLEAGVTYAETSATTSDAGGKDLDVSGMADGNYSIVLEAVEEVVRPTGAGAIDTYLEGVNVGEETANKIRFVYKINVIETADLVSNPTFPLAVTNHMVNEIEITPSVSENFLVSSVDITQDVNGADRRIVLDNSAGNLPFSTDANPYINGTFIDSDGNRMRITSITTTDAGATVQFLLDREVAYNSAIPSSSVPVITNGVPFKLLKKDFFVTSSSGDPQGQHYFRVSDFVMSGGVISSLSDLRTVTAVNSFGVDHNVRLVGGGIISWNATTGDLTHDGEFEISIPGLTGRALISSSTINIPSDDDVAFVYLDREAVSNYAVVPTILPKDEVPANVNVYVIAERKDSRLYFPHGGSIGDSETGILGAFGATLDKDLSEDLIIDALSENGLDEVFAETFNDQDSVDLPNLTGMTFEPFQKQYRASASARFVNYDGQNLPAAHPTDPWTKLGTQLEGIGSGILTLTDASIGDRVAYSRTESSLTENSHTDHSFRARLTANGGTPPNFLYELRDGTKHFSLAITPTDVELRDGIGSVLSSFALSTSAYHTYRVVKIGNQRVQYYVDNILRGSVAYSDISTSAAGNNDIVWGTTVTSTATLDIDFVKFNIYGSILQSVDIFRHAGLFYNADVLPDDVSLSAEAWTINGGGAGITPSVSDGILNIVDTTNAIALTYSRTEALLARFANAELEMRVRVNSGSLNNFEQFGLRIKDGFKDMALWIRDDGGQLKAGLYDAGTSTLKSGEYNIETDKYVVIKLVKTRDTAVSIYINGIYQTQLSYSEFTSYTADTEYEWGCFTNTPEFDVDIDYVQYTVPGQGSLAASPVRDFLTIINGNDPFPIAWISTDNGGTWHETVEGQTTSINDNELIGGNVIARIGLSKSNSVLTDYGVLYNKTNFDIDGQFEYARVTAVGGETAINIPFVYTTGVNELQVHFRPAGSGATRKLTEGLDYTEPNGTSIALVAIVPQAGDIFEFRNQFTQDPIIPPAVNFTGHDHSGSQGESDVLNPVDINASGNIDVGGNITIGNIDIDGATDNVTGVANLDVDSLQITGASGHSSSEGFANVVIDAYSRPTTGDIVSERGVAVSNASGLFNTTSGTFVDVTNLEVTITTSGRPVKIMLVGDPANTAQYGIFDLSGVSEGNFSGGMQVQILRDATVVEKHDEFFKGRTDSAGDIENYRSPGGVQTVDIVAAGTYTYKLQVRSTGATALVNHCKLVAYEL